MADDDDFSYEETDKGFFWTYTSPGGAEFRAPAPAKTKAAAKKAAAAWLSEMSK